MSDTNNPQPPGPRPPQNAKTEGLAPWEIGRETPPQPSPAQRPPAPNSQGLAPWEIGRETPPQPTVQPSPAQRPPAPNSQGLAPWEIGGPNRPVQTPQNPVTPPNIYSGPDAAGGPYRPVHDPSFQVRDASGAGRKVGIVALCAAFLLVGWFIAAEFIPMPVGAPPGYATYKSPDGRYAIAIPTTWSQTSNPVTQDQDGSVRIAVFKDGPARIDITTDTVAHLKGQVLLNSSAALPPDFTADPTKALNDYEAGRVANTLKHYSETAPTSLDTNYGPALVSTFTGLGGMFGWGGPTHGYRASVATDDTTFEIVTQCPDGDWKALSPAFLHMIQSIGPVGGGVYTPQPGTTSPTPGIPSIGGIDMGSD